MSYEPTNWKSGDTVTSAKLNKMEQGIANAGGVFFVHSTVNEAGTGEVLDKTWQEIRDATATSVVMLERDGEDGHFSYLSSCNHVTAFGESWNVSFLADSDTYLFVTTVGANGYPIMIYE